MTIGRRLSPHVGTLSLAALGLAALCIYVFTAAVPFSILNLRDERLLTFAGLTGQTRAGVMRYLLTLGVPFLLYLGGFLVLWRWRVSKAPVFAFPVLLSLGLFLVYPLTAQDVFLYGAQGWNLSHHGANPLVVPPAAFADNPFLGWTAYTAQPSAYGPLWNYLAALSTLLGGSPVAAVLGFKALGLVALVAGVVLTYDIANRLRPGSGVLAAYTLGWNPLVLWVTIANGHNDMVMTALILAGVFFLLHRPVLSIPTLVVAGLVKYAAFVLLPVFVVYLWHRRYPLPRLALSLGLAAGCGALLMAPLWEGSRTLAALQEQMGDMITMSPGATLAFWAQARGLPADSAEELARDLLYIVFAVAYAAALFNVRKGIDSVVVASFAVLLALLMLATFWFRSWYVVWPLALAAPLIGTHRWLAVAGVTFSGTALLVYLFTDYLWVWYGADLELHLILMAVVFAPPLVVLAAGAGLRLAVRRDADSDFIGAHA